MQGGKLGPKSACLYEERNDKMIVINRKIKRGLISVLSPVLVNTILQIDDQINGKLYIELMRDGRISMGIHSDNRFMMAKDVYEPLPQLRERMRQEIRFPLMLLDMIL